MANRTQVTLTAAQKRAEALRLRLKGLDYRTIAERVGYASVSSAHKAVTQELAKIPKAAADELRTVELERYDTAQRLIMSKIRKGDLDAVHAMIRLSDQRAKLTGLYADQTQTEHVEVTLALRAFLAEAEDQADAEDATAAADAQVDGAVENAA